MQESIAGAGSRGWEAPPVQAINATSNKGVARIIFCFRL